VKKLLIALAFLCQSVLAADVYTNTTVYDNAILLGSPQQAYRAGLVISQSVTLSAGDVAMVTGEGEGSIYIYPWGSGIYSFPIFVSTTLVVYPPGTTMPTITPLGNWQGGLMLSPGIGTDISQATTYYAPVVRSASFKATTSGAHVFALYWWGGSALAGSGNSAIVYPGTSKITVIVIP
jgi:hypothetical protein